jgi:hypothetical protein
MKKSILVTTLILCAFALLAVSVFAADVFVPTGKNVNVVFSPERDAVVFIDGATAMGDSAAVDLGFHASKMACTMTTGGTAPTAVTITLKRSTDGGTSYADIFSHTYTVATVSTQAFDSAYVGRYWKASYDGRTGGDETTAVTLKCDVKE